VDGSRAPNITTSSADATSDGTTDGGTNTGTTANQSPGGRRNLRYSTTKQDGNLQDESKRRDLTNRWSEIDASVLRGFVKSDRTGWRLLQRTDHGEAHEIDLDDEYKVQIHLLLA
jgi:hypothetical protein